MILAKTREKNYNERGNKMNEKREQNTFGAITDTGSKEAKKHAELYYDEIRSFSTDVARIAERTEFSYDQILLVKNYLFMDKHILDKSSEPRYFDACFEIAESWQRLSGMSSDICPHDIMNSGAIRRKLDNKTH